MRENDFDEENFFNQDNSSHNNFENNINNYSNLNPQISTIKKKSTIPMSALKTLKDLLNDIKYPYPNKEEIPLIKIKGENYFENGKDIGHYIKSLIKFDDNKFNICRECKQEQNKFFCEKCNKN